MLSKEEQKLVQVQSIFFFTSGMAGVFFQIFLFKLSGFAEVMYFNIALFVALFGAYVASGYFLRYRSTRTLMRLGLLGIVCVWLSVLILREHTKDYFLPLGLLYGVAGGFYWSGFNLTQYILTHSERRSHFFGNIETITNVAKALAPFIAGSIIFVVNRALESDLFGYYVLFSIVFLLQVYVVIQAKYLPRHSGVVFSIQHLFERITTKRWKLILAQQFVSGLYDNGLATLSGILMYTVLLQETSVGLLQSLTAFVMAASSYMIGRRYKHGSRVYILGAIGAAGALFLFGVAQNVYTVAIYMLLYGFAIPALNIPTAVAILSGYDEGEETWQHKYEMFIQRDSALGVARIASFVLLFVLFSRYDKVIVAQVWFLVAAVVPLVLALLLHIIVNTAPRK